jgi:hypothetical protein
MCVRVCVTYGEHAESSLLLLLFFFSASVLPAQGFGDLNAAVLKVGGRTSNAFTFAYDPPIIQGIVSSTPDANGVLVTFQGKNFGWQRLPLDIVINSMPCLSPLWLNDAQVQCVTAMDVVGIRNISLLGANRSTPLRIWDFQQQMIAMCVPSFYGVQGQLCLPCPVGAFCPGGELLVDRVVALKGFYRMPPSLTPASVCGPDRQDPATGTGTCVYTLACAPEEACLGNNLCELVSRGVVCGI